MEPIVAGGRPDLLATEMNRSRPPDLRRYILRLTTCSRKGWDHNPWITLATQAVEL
ncbi:MAG TPA: hypothetical protein PKA06_08420 [Gemmatales bacterium]|nr:hypothetical protein [Gemmatales bacterium]